MEESDTNVIIKWKHPCDRPPTSHYIITTIHLSTGTRFTTRPATRTTLTADSTTTTVNDIGQVNGTVYIFVVTAVSGDTSLSSQPAQFKIRTFKFIQLRLVYIHASDPLFLFHSTAYSSSISPPSDVSVTKLTSTSASISWTPPEVLPSLYIIYCVPLETNEVKAVQPVGREQNSYTQSGLSEGSSYIIVVIARGATTTAADPVVFTSGILISDVSLDKKLSYLRASILPFVYIRTGMTFLFKVIGIYKWGGD